MTGPSTEQREAIRRSCKNLRRLLFLTQPAGFLAILHDVGSIECDALVATGVEFQAVRESLHILLRQLRDQGIITPERWKEFFGEAELQ
jgi:hypothetical protein